jgi:hypothetical protein
MKRWHKWAIVAVLVLVLAWALWPKAGTVGKPKLLTVSDPADDPSLVVIDNNTGKALT